MRISTMTSRALALLAAFASPLFMAAAIAGWLSGTWPATPLTLALAAFAVIGGPLLGFLHVATAHEDDGEPMLALVPVEGRRRRIPLDAVSETPRLAEARRFHNWRDRPNDVLSRREHEEHLRRTQLRAREIRRSARAAGRA
jgi:hypothetical protein